MQLGIRPGAAPKMCPDKLTQFNPDGERQETMGFPYPGTATHPASVSTHVTFSLRRRKQQFIGAHLLCSSSSIIHQSLSPASSWLVLDFYCDPFLQ